MEVKETFSFPHRKLQLPQLERMISNIYSPFYVLNWVSRRNFVYSSTSPAQIIHGRLNNNQSVYLFCKYSGNHTQYSFGHRGGVEYENEIYKTVLANCSLSSPPYYGFCLFEKSSDACLVIGYLKNSILLKDSRDPEDFGRAAAWIGQFHRMHEAKHKQSIRVYDRSYYMIWLKGMETLLRTLQKKYSWLPSVCDYFKENLHLLTDGHQTIIHGEYYTKNIIVQKDMVYPIDWESAALGPGETDLVSLIEDWDEARKDIAFKNYIQARWPDGAINRSVFEKKLLLVRIYFFLRWTAEYNDPELWLTRNEWFKRFYQTIKESGYQPLEV